MLIGDNGFYLGEYGLAGKWFPHEESIRVPLVVFDPRAGNKLRGRTVDQVVLNVDIAPTILELAGLKPPEQMQGSSLVPLLKGKQDYKYARYTDYDYEELYDLKLDPDESINLAKDEKYKKTLESLRKRCDKLAREAKGT